MKIDPDAWQWQRYYTVRPEQKSIEQCASHGSDHKAYGWSPQIDPRWSEEQKAAYIEAYEKTPRE